jgi:hypothetical protein
MNKKTCIGSLPYLDPGQAVIDPMFAAGLTLGAIRAEHDQGLVSIKPKPR